MKHLFKRSVTPAAFVVAFALFGAPSSPVADWALPSAGDAFAATYACVSIVEGDDVRGNCTPIANPNACPSNAQCWICDGSFYSPCNLIVDNITSDSSSGGGGGSSGGGSGGGYGSGGSSGGSGSGGSGGGSGGSTGGGSSGSEQNEQTSGETNGTGYGTFDHSACIDDMLEAGISNALAAQACTSAKTGDIFCQFAQDADYALGMGAFVYGSLELATATGHVIESRPWMALPSLARAARAGVLGAFVTTYAEVCRLFVR